MMPRLRHAVFVVAATCSGATAAFADNGASVQVSTVMTHRATVPVQAQAFGSIMPSGTGVIALVQPLDGWVSKLDVTPGQGIKAGDAILEWRAAANIVSAFEQAASAVTLALAQLQHTRALLGQRLATQDQLDQATKAVSDAKANYDALKSEGGDRRTIVIRAPADGVVSAMPVSQGQRVMAGTPLAMFATAAGLVATVGVEPSAASQVHVGDPAKISALNGGSVSEGQVVRVDARIDPVSRLVTVDIKPSSDTLMNGADVSATIETAHVEGWIVPHAAVQFEGTDSYVMQAINAHAVRVPVQVTAQLGDQDVLSGGIDAAHAVITDGSYQLSNGDAIRAVDKSGTAQ